MRRPGAPRLSLARLAGAFAAAALLGGCSTVGVLNAVEPRGGGAVTRDLAYGDNPRQRLDVYAPKAGGGRAPVVVFFYGGSWEDGEKSAYAFVGKALAAHGYVAVLPDYRLYPEVRYPEFLRDGARATAWARTHAAEYGGDPARLVLMGHSAGAYNAAMLALDGRWLGEVGMAPDRDVRAFVGLAGPYDFLPLRSDTLKVIFGPEDQRRQTQPIVHLAAGAPPLWLGHDMGDKLVETANTTRLAAAARARGVAVEERYYRHVNHQLMVGTLAAPLRFLAPAFRDLTAFIDARAGAPNPGAPVR